MTLSPQDKGMTAAPVALFTYNRPNHTERVIASLIENHRAGTTDLFVYSDGPRRPSDAPLVQNVREILHSIQGFKSVNIIEHSRNHGLAHSVITGVSDVILRYGKVIVVEDDLLLSRNFLAFMNTMLNFYAPFSRVHSVSGFTYAPENLPIPDDYPYDVYLSHRCFSWGWATWLDRWKKADWEVSDFDLFLRSKKTQRLFNQGGEDLSDMLKLQKIGKVDSWAIRWCYAHFRQDAFCLCPVRSFVKNLGFDGSGTHCGMSKRTIPCPVIDDDWMPSKLLDRILVDPKIMRSFYQIHQRSLVTRLKTKIKLLRKMGS